MIVMHKTTLLTYLLVIMGCGSPPCNPPSAVVQHELQWIAATGAATKRSVDAFNAEAEEVIARVRDTHKLADADKLDLESGKITRAKPLLGPVKTDERLSASEMHEIEYVGLKRERVLVAVSARDAAVAEVETRLRAQCAMKPDDRFDYAAGGIVRAAAGQKQTTKKEVR